MVNNAPKKSGEVTAVFQTSGGPTNVGLDAENPWEDPNENNLPMVGFRHLC